jgi:uncharacterized protein (DUF111 family)
MTVTAVGYGAGTADLEGAPNVMRLVVGDGGPGCPAGLERDRVALVETNIDDMNPQFFSHVYEGLFAHGAVDVWVEHVLMKKGRPGFVLSVLGPQDKAQALAQAVLALTTSSGVRIREADRLKLPRRTVEVATRFGKIKAKVFRVESSDRCVPEYDDCLRVSRSLGLPVSDVIDETKRAFLVEGAHDE